MDFNNDYWDNLMSTDENASVYMATYNEGIGAKTRQELNHFINDGESVLDVGCGPGWNLNHFLEYGPKVKRYKGIDLSPRFVRVANKRRQEKEIPKNYALPFEIGDCRDIKESKDSWDVVILQDVLEHTNGFEKPVKEALRVARKRVIVTFWHLEETDSPHINDDTDKGTNGYGAWYDKRMWEDFLDDLGIFWVEHEFYFPEHRLRHFYIIDKGI